MRPKEHYEDLRVTVGWSLRPQITVNGSGTVYFSKDVDFSIYPECYPQKELNEWPINPYTKEKLKEEEEDETENKDKRGFIAQNFSRITKVWERIRKGDFRGYTRCSK